MTTPKPMLAEQVILQLQRDLAAAQERINKSEADIAAMTTYAKTQQERAQAAEARAEAMAEELHSWERTFCSSGEFSPALRDYRAAQEKP